MYKEKKITVSNISIMGITKISLPVIRKYNLCGNVVKVDDLDNVVLGVASDFGIKEDNPYCEIDKAITYYNDRNLVKRSDASKVDHGNIQILMSEQAADSELGKLNSLYGKNYVKVRELIKERM